MKRFAKHIICQLCVIAMLLPALLFGITYKTIQAIANQCYEPTLFVILASMERFENRMLNVTWKLKRWAYYDDSEGYNG